MSKRKRVLIPLPSSGFDPTESGVIFKYLVDQNIDVTIATPNGKVASVDTMMITGLGLGILKPFLIADKNGQVAFKFMKEHAVFNSPQAYSEINPDDYDALFLPGGHHKGMREYLDSDLLKKVCIDFFEKDKVVGAICHGLVLLSRCALSNQESIIRKYKVTALLKKQELLAYYLTKIYLGDYYLTYSTTVEDEVKSILEDQNLFMTGLRSDTLIEAAFLKRDSFKNLKRGFVVIDKNLITARWPGDAHLFAMKFTELLYDYKKN